MANGKKIIDAPALSFTWYTGLIAIVAPLGAALIALLGPLKDQPQPIVVAIIATVGIGLLAASIAAAADVLARAWVTAAKVHSSGETIGARFAVRVPVLSVRWDANENKTWYLVKESGVIPQWISEDKVEG